MSPAKKRQKSSTDSEHDSLKGSSAEQAQLEPDIRFQYADDSDSSELYVVIRDVIKLLLGPPKSSAKSKTVNLLISQLTTKFKSEFLNIDDYTLCRFDAPSKLIACRLSPSLLKTLLQFLLDEPKVEADGHVLRTRFGLFVAKLRLHGCTFKPEDETSFEDIAFVDLSAVSSPESVESGEGFGSDLDESGDESGSDENSDETSSTIPYFGTDTCPESELETLDEQPVPPPWAPTAGSNNEPCATAAEPSNVQEWIGKTVHLGTKQSGTFGTVLQVHSSPTQFSIRLDNVPGQPEVRH